MVGEIQEEVPVLMSGAGHDAMAISHLTKVCSLIFVPQLFQVLVLHLHQHGYIEFDRLECCSSVVVEA